MHSARAVARAVAQEVADDRPVRETQHVVELRRGVLRVAARVRAAEHGDRSLGAEQVAQRVGEQGRFGERADEDDVDLGGKLLRQVLQAGVADEADLVPFGLAPGGDDLRHDARHVGVHRARVERPRRALGDQIDDRDSQTPHEVGPSAA